MATVTSLLLVFFSARRVSALHVVERRSFCWSFCGGALLAPASARAGIVEDFVLPNSKVDFFFDDDSFSPPLNRATVATRVLIVRGAQLADALDARWDALSYAVRRRLDPSGVRQDASARPQRRDLDRKVAGRVRDAADTAAAFASGVSASTVREKIAENRETFKGLLSRGDGEDDEGFQFDTYCAFRAYNSLASQKRIRFEEKYGDLLYSMFPPSEEEAERDDLESATQSMLQKLVDAGFADRVEVDFQDGVDSRISATLFRPKELRPRLLLETQSRRLGLTILPDVATTLLRAHLSKIHENPPIEEYFVDTEYRTTFDKDDYTALQIEIVLS